VIAVVDAGMVQALRRVSVERGVDPRTLALVAFGGAGPLHACALADALGMAAVVVPPRAGVLCAAGLLAAPRQVDLVRSWPDPGDHAGAVRAAAELGDEASRALSAGAGSEADVAVAFDCRYAGQSHELTVPAISGFEAEHTRRNGYARPGQPVEVVAVRAVARQPSPVDLADLGDPGTRHGVHRGPAVIAEADCTIWVAPGWSAAVGGGGAWVLTR
jgi:N-methylhydantoinase A/oxoprolinase/acetone carboxylase beta subunit